MTLEDLEAELEETKEKIRINREKGESTSALYKRHTQLEKLIHTERLINDGRGTN